MPVVANAQIGNLRQKVTVVLQYRIVERPAFLKVAADSRCLAYKRGAADLHHSSKGLRPAQDSSESRRPFIPDSPDFNTSAFARVAHKRNHGIDRKIDVGFGLIRLEKNSATRQFDRPQFSRDRFEFM